MARSLNCCCKVFGTSTRFSGTGSGLRGRSLILGARGLGVTSSGGWCVDVGAGEVSGGWGRKATEVDSNTLKGGFVLG